MSPWLGRCVTPAPPLRVAVVVAHPDDETLWAGGTLLAHPEWSLFVVTLCRGSDPDRAPRFASALRYLRAEGRMGDLDDGPGQHPLPEEVVARTVLELLPARHYDLILTHGPRGEYTRHRRHEEASRAVSALIMAGLLRAEHHWQFAYEDWGDATPPCAARDRDLSVFLSSRDWHVKRHIMRSVYGFSDASWETRTTPAVEAFRRAPRYP